MKFKPPKNLDHQRFELTKTDIGQNVLYPYLDTVREMLTTNTNDDMAVTFNARYSLDSSAILYYRFNINKLIRYIMITFIDECFPELNIGTKQNVLAHFESQYKIEDYVLPDVMERMVLQNVDKGQEHIFYISTQIVSSIYTYFNQLVNYIAMNYQDGINDPNSIPIFRKVITITNELLNKNVYPNNVPIPDQYLYSINVLTEMIGIYYNYILDAVFNIINVVSEMYIFANTESTKSKKEKNRMSKCIGEYMDDSFNDHVQ